MTLDLVMAVSAFAFLLMLFLASWNAVLNNVREFDDSLKLEYAVIISSRSMFSTGYPPGWHLSPYDPAQQIGILERPGIISEQKLARLENLNSTSYDDIRIGMGAGQYQIFLNVSGNYTFGIPPAENSTSRVTERLMLLAGNTTEATLTLWH